MALCRLARIRKVADQHEQTRKDMELKREALKRKRREQPSCEMERRRIEREKNSTAQQ